jgi:hypothetical protein
LTHRATVVLLAALSLAACNPARVGVTGSYAGAPLPAPQSVLVYAFDVAPQDVALDQGIRARLTRLASGASTGTDQMQAARATDDALVAALVARLRSYGLNAQPAAGPPPASGTALLVRGRIQAIDEGNTTRRMVVGLGAGKSSFSAVMQTYYAHGAAAPRLLQSTAADADSGHAPGAAGTMGAGAVAGSSLAVSAAASTGMHGLSERRAASDTALATKAGEGLARQIGVFAVSQGWLPPGAVP